MDGNGDMVSRVEDCEEGERREKKRGKERKKKESQAASGSIRQRVEEVWWPEGAGTQPIKGSFYTYEERC